MNLGQVMKFPLNAKICEIVEEVVYSHQITIPEIASDVGTSVSAFQALFSDTLIGDIYHGNRRITNTQKLRNMLMILLFVQRVTEVKREREVKG